MKSIYRSKTHADTIKILTKKNLETDMAVFPTIKALQCFAAVVGFDNKRRVELDRRNVENIEWHTFESTQHTHYIYLIALAETNDLNILKNKDDPSDSEPSEGDNMFVIFEEYANGGFEIIQSWLNKTPGDPYGNRALLVAMEKAGYMKREAKEFEEVEF